MPEVSIIIPAYNCAQFLKHTLDSVLTQTSSDYEIILVDDGSTDNTPEVLSPYLSKIQYIRQENAGLPSARNAGILASSGRFIALLDGDDTWTPNKLHEQMPRFSDPEVGIVYSDFSIQYSDGRFLQSYLSQRPLAGEGYILDNYIQSRFLFPSTMVLRRECFDQFGLFDPEMLASEDVELFSRMCTQWKVALVRQQLMIRNEGGHNLTADQLKLSRYTVLAFQKFLAAIHGLSQKTVKLARQQIGVHSWYQGYAAFKAGNMAEARRRLTTSMRYDPGTTRQCLPVLLAACLPVPVLRLIRRPA